MRFINWLIHLFLVALLCWGFDLHAQTQGNAPSPTDSLINATTSGNTAGNILNTAENFLSGDTVLVGYTQDASSPGGTPDCSTGPYTIADSSANTWTSFTARVTTEPGQQRGYQMYCSVITAPGADTITVTPTSSSCTKNISYLRFPSSQNVTCDLDGSEQTTNVQHNNSNTVQSLSTTHSTSYNGDAIVSLIVCTGCIDTQAVNTQSIVSNTAAISAFMHVLNTGVAGSYSPTFSYIDGHLQYGLASVALKVSTINIVTTALADCAIGVTCTQNLQAVGGSGAYTWSITSGSVSGMAIDPVTGVFADTGAGPTAQGSFSLTFHVTDGTASASANLTQVVGSAFRTPAVLDSQFTFTFNNGGATLTPFGSSTMTCGSSVLMLMNNATDADYGEGYLQALAGSGNYYVATVGGIATSVTRVPLFSGTVRGPVYGILFGPFTNTGTFSVAGINNRGMSSAINVGFYNVSNVQSVVDTAAFNGKAVTADSSIAVSTTTLAPNEFVASLSSGYRSISATLAAPFTRDYTDVSLGTGSVYAHALVSLPSSVTSTATITGSGGSSTIDDYQAYLVALRPRLPMAACSEPTGSTVRHRVQIY